MARRRMISQEIILDEDFNSLSIHSQNIFIRLLSVSDDFGFVPANEYTLNKLINTPNKINLQNCLQEIVSTKLGFLFEYDGKKFFLFKRDRFDEYQSYLIQKRTKSEYLRLSKETIDSEKFQEVLRNYSEHRVYPIESKEYQVESIKQKEQSFDFDTVWKLYPDKTKKQEALRHFNATVKTEEDFANINKAVRNYLQCKRVKDGYIQNGSTWFNDWQSWIEPTEHMMKGINNNGSGTKQSATSNKYDSVPKKS